MNAMEAIQGPWQLALCNQIKSRHLMKMEAKFNQNYRNTEYHLQDGVLKAIAAVLENSQIIISRSYSFLAALGQLDGLVVGKFNGEDVVVLIKTKPNMDYGFSKVKSELIHLKEYWRYLSTVETTELEDDECLIDDYTVLRVSEFKNRKMMYAIGGYNFSDETRNKWSKTETETSWFRVISNNFDQFEVNFETPCTKQMPEKVTK